MHLGIGGCFVFPIKKKMNRLGNAFAYIRVRRSVPEGAACRARRPCAANLPGVEVDAVCGILQTSWSR
jgi:hypothetical protein